MKRIMGMACIVLVAFFASTYPVFAQMDSSTLASPSSPDIERRVERLRLFAKIFELIDKMYLYDVDLEKCQYDILKALTGGSLRHDDAQAPDTAKEEFVCLDRFSRFLTPNELEQQTTSMRGSFAGIGVRIKTRQEGNKSVIEVISLFEGGPAAQAGMQKGDIILRARESDEVTFTELKDAAHAVERIRGVTGSSIVIVIKRGGEEITLPGIVRKTLDVPSAHFLSLPDNVGYVRISSFTEHTGDELEEALATFSRAKQPRVIIDVRENPGGLLASTLESLFLFSGDADDILVTERGKQAEQIFSIGSLMQCEAETGKMTSCFVYPATGEYKQPGRFANYQIVVLVDGHSASAAELFAGVLKNWGSQYGNFVVVGETTFGKGVVQTQVAISHAAGKPPVALTLTTSEYFVGNAQASVHGVGVTPNFVVEDSRTKVRELESAAMAEVLVEQSASRHKETLTRDDAQFVAALRIWGLDQTSEMREFLGGQHVNEYGDVTK